jgi:predicted lipoprotein with Yx(FWY)xxD motif
VIPITGATATAMPVATLPPAATATMAPMATPTSPAVVNVGQNSTLGSFLVDSNGMTLYIFTKDTQGTSSAAAASACSGNCATLWPPLLTNGAPTAGTGVTGSMLGTLTRSDGSVQVTYNGWPLYSYSKDMAAGDTNGEGVGTFWYVINPTGMQASAALPAAAATTPSPANLVSSPPTY